MRRVRMVHARTLRSIVHRGLARGCRSKSRRGAIYIGGPGQAIGHVDKKGGAHRGYGQGKAVLVMGKRRRNGPTRAVPVGFQKRFDGSDPSRGRRPAPENPRSKDEVSGVGFGIRRRARSRPPRRRRLPLPGGTIAVGGKGGFQCHQTDHHVFLAAGVAHRSDAPDPSRQRAEGGSYLDPEVLEHHGAHRIAGDAARNLHSGDIRHLMGLISEAHESHRIEPRANGATARAWRAKRSSRPSCRAIRAHSRAA